MRRTVRTRPIPPHRAHRLVRGAGVARLCTGAVVLALLCAPPARLPAQGAPAPASATAVAPSPDPADVASLDAILCALYASISGPAGAPRDFARLRSLLDPGARFVPTGRAADGGSRLRNWSVEEYVAAAGPGLVASGFFEREIGRAVSRFGSVWHVLSAYDSRRTLADAAPFQRGVNSIQLHQGSTGWRIVSIMWDAERPDLPIPADLLAQRPTATCRGAVP